MAPAMAFLTASLSAAGHMDDAKGSAQALRDRFPAFSLAGYRSQSIFRNPDDTDRVIDALRNAGLPD